MSTKVDQNNLDQNNQQYQRPGAIALVGSGEYTPAMKETDLVLLNTCGGAGQARVVVIPTAAGLEEAASPARWTRMGLEHFKALGASVEGVSILARKDAEDPRWFPLLERADFYYFSGGDPHHLVATMINTPAWEIIARRHAEGAVLAGCSAGAMAVSGYTMSPRKLMSGKMEWEKALGVLPTIGVMPHFDRMIHYMGEETFTRIVRAVPPQLTLIGVDENTALVRRDPPPEDGSPAAWHVLGQGTVTIFDGIGPDGKSLYYHGQSLYLPGA